MSFESPSRDSFTRVACFKFRTLSLLKSESLGVGCWKLCIDKSPGKKHWRNQEWPQQGGICESGWMVNNTAFTTEAIKQGLEVLGVGSCLSSQVCHRHGTEKTRIPHVLVSLPQTFHDYPTAEPLPPYGHGGIPHEHC